MRQNRTMAEKPDSALPAPVVLTPSVVMTSVPMMAVPMMARKCDRQRAGSLTDPDPAARYLVRHNRTRYGKMAVTMATVPPLVWSQTFL